MNSFCTKSLILTFVTALVLSGCFHEAPDNKSSTSPFFNDTSGQQTTPTQVINQEALASISILPKQITLKPGETLEPALSVVASYVSGKNENVTNDVAWEYNVDEFTVDEQNKLTAGESPGTFEIRASYRDISARETVIIKAETTASENNPATPGSSGSNSTSDNNPNSTDTGSDSANQNNPDSQPTNTTPGSTVSNALAQQTNPQPAVLESIIVNLVHSTIKPTQSTTVSAIAKYDNGVQENVTNSVTWSTDNPDIADFNGTGIITGNASGTASVTATLIDNPSIQGIATLTVEAVDNAQLSFNGLTTSYMEISDTFRLRAYDDSLGVMAQLYGYTGLLPGVALVFEDLEKKITLFTLLVEASDITTGEKFYSLGYANYKDTGKNLSYGKFAGFNNTIAFSALAENVGDVYSGNFNIGLCNNNVEASACIDSTNQRVISGEFQITRETPLVIENHTSAAFPITLSLNTGEPIPLDDTKPYYGKIDLVAGQYSFALDSTNANTRMTVSSDPYYLIEPSCTITSGSCAINTEQKAWFFKLEIVDSAISTDDVATITPSFSSQGLLNAPMELAAGVFTTNGIVAQSQPSYYHASIFPGRTYQLNTYGSASAVPQIYSDTLFTNELVYLDPCPDTLLGKTAVHSICFGPAQNGNIENIYIKVDGSNSTGNGELFSMNLTLTSVGEGWDAPVMLNTYEGEMALPITDVQHFSQVGAGNGASAQGSNAGENAGSYYGAVLETNTYYYLDISGLISLTQLYVNMGSFGQTTPCAIAGDANTGLQCFFNSGNSTWATLNFIGSVLGSTLNLKMTKIDPATHRFYTIVTRNIQRDTSDATSPQYDTSSRFVTVYNADGSSILSKSSIAFPNISTGDFITSYNRSVDAISALIALQPGDEVKIRVNDIYRDNGYYALYVQEAGTPFLQSLIPEPLVPEIDSTEPFNDQIQNASTIELGEVTFHSLIKESGTQVDSDWFSFTAPAQ